MVSAAHATVLSQSILDDAALTAVYELVPAHTLFILYTSTVMRGVKPCVRAIYIGLAGVA